MLQPSVEDEAVAGGPLAVIEVAKPVDSDGGFDCL